MNASVRVVLLQALLLAGIVVGLAAATNQSTIRATLLPPGEREPAPDFRLQDSAGKKTRLSRYQGKLVLLDFWATWCTGCKSELPMFAELQKDYGPKGLVVIGVSLDDGGWKVVKPYLDTLHAPYRMLLGDDATARRYGIGNMPNTFLIDRKGRIAAAYRAGLVDKADVQAHIEVLLSTRR